MQTNQKRIAANQAGSPKKRMAVFAVALTAMILVVAGCNGSGGTSSPLNGTFIDSAVEGVNYQTHDASGNVTGTGTTDADGTFAYHDGDTVQFMIGDVVLGEAPAKDVITPLDLAEATDGTPVDLNNQVVTNMGRFLQSLDADGNPENGITITPDVSQEVSGRMIDFNMPVDDFEVDAHVSAMFDTLDALDMPHNGGSAGGMITVEQAREHMQAHMGQYMTGMMGTGETAGFGAGMTINNNDSGSGFSMMDGNGDYGMDLSTGTGAGSGMVSNDGSSYMGGGMMGGSGN
ncbi:MAG: hypothetical protein GXP53_08665 [Deltaproteobacteria bacterium]|nr:hypothetical protein [Deltaproteobacteria bacterium]